MNIFDNKNKLDCTSKNPNYIFLVTTFWQLLSDSVLLIEQEETEMAKIVLSQTIQKFFPEEPSSLNMLPKAEIFYGESAKKFSVIYFELLELWKFIQDDGISFLTGNEYQTDPKKLQQNLLIQKKLLEEILDDCGIKN